MMAIPIDVLIVGGGVQGLALLRELADDFSVLLVGSDPRVSESLHFHGYFSSGWNAANVESAATYHRAALDWHARLKRYDLSGRQTSFHAALPPAAVEALAANWKQVQIPAVEAAFPAPFQLDRLADHRVFRFADDLVFDGAAALRRFREPVAQQTRSGQVVGLERQGRRVATVAVQLRDKTLQFKPAMTVAACGAGNAQLLKWLALEERTVRESQVARPLHMLLARGPDLPRVSGFLLDLVLVYHPYDDHEGLWIITLDPAEPKFTAGVVNMANDPKLEPDLIRDSLRKLAAVVPEFSRLAAGCKWDVYVGWKTDAPGPQTGPLVNLEYPVPYHVHDFGLTNFLAVWPNHWCLSTPAAALAAGTVRDRIAHNHDLPQLPPDIELSPDSQRDKWARADRRWQDWRTFAKKFDYDET